MVAPPIAIEIAYATPAKQKILALSVKTGSSLIDCIKTSGIFYHFPEIDINTLQAGIWGKVKPLEHIVEAGDRIEIYRPLITDPKASRRRRADKSARYKQTR